MLPLVERRGMAGAMDDLAGRQNHERDVAAARAALGDEVFSGLLAEGEAMTMKESITYALNDPPE